MDFWNGYSARRIQMLRLNTTLGTPNSAAMCCSASRAAAPH
jgi:hypothetical protein